MKLTVPDLKLLGLVLECGHRLERAWPMSDQALAQKELSEFCSRIENLKKAQSEDLKRLASTVEHLNVDMTSRHLAGFLVAFERLNNKALRDDEFLVIEGDLTQAASNPEPIIVIADNIRSAFNVGAIFRTAECYNLSEVVLTGYTATPDDEKTARTSMGTAEYLSWRSIRETSMAVTEAKLRGFTVVALETVQTATDLDSFDWPEKCAILVGNERFGVDREALALADHIVKIPLRGRKNSLNVGISLGIALHSRFLPVKPTRSVQASRETRYWEIAPIGIFRSESVHPYEAPRQATEDQSELMGEIELFSNFPSSAQSSRSESGAQSSRSESGAQSSHSEPSSTEDEDEDHSPLLPKLQGLEQGLKDLDGFSKIWLIYRFHHNQNWKPMVLPPRGPQVKRGVFATRAPYRPNAIGLSCVDLIKIEGRKLYVRGFDLLDQTPIFDIKPYIAYADSHPEAAQGWLEGLDESANRVRFSPAAEEQLEWLEGKGLSQLRGFVQAQLKFDALDDKRKRVSSTGVDGMHELAYRTWRLSFYFDAESKSVSILSVYSGYSPEDLAPGSNDPHDDKELHRQFVRNF